MDKREATTAALVVLLVGLGGCASTSSTEDWPSQALGFVQDGALTREQALLKMAEPSGRFENDRILTYRLARNGPGNFKVVPRSSDVGAPTYGNIDYSLVLVFNGGVLQRHSLVSMK